MTNNNNNNNNNENNQNKKNILMLFVRAHGMKSPASAKAGNIFGAADSFFEVWNDEKEVVARSSIQYNDVSPKWPPIKLDLETLCGNDESRMVYLSFYDYNGNTNNNENDENHEWMKTILTTVHGMKQAAHDCQTQQQQQEPYKIGGRIRVDIYDAIVTTGIPTMGTLTKSSNSNSTPLKRTKRTNNNHKKQLHVTSEGATESETLSSLSDDEEVTIVDDNIGRILSFRSDASDHLDDAAARADAALEQLTIETLDFETLGVVVDDDDDLLVVTLDSAPVVAVAPNDLLVVTLDSPAPVPVPIVPPSCNNDLPTVQDIASLFQQATIMTDEDEAFLY